MKKFALALALMLFGCGGPAFSVATEGVVISDDAGRTEETAADAGSGVEAAIDAGSTADTSSVDSSSSVQNDSESEAGPPVIPCFSWALGGIGMPPGTIATGSATYQSDVAALAIDGILTDYWQPGDYSGWLELQFPSPQTIIGIRMAAWCGDVDMVSYTVMSSTSTTIGGATESVGSVGGAAPYTIEPAISITPGTYTRITINVSDPMNWVKISEVSLLTTACP